MIGATNGDGRESGQVPGPGPELDHEPGHGNDAVASANGGDNDHPVDGPSTVDEPSTVDDEGIFEPVSDPVATARRRHGTAGAVLAAGLFGIDIALGRKPKEEIPVVVASNDEPTDVDAEGIELAIDDHTSVVAPALPRLDPPRPAGRRRHRRR